MASSGRSKDRNQRNSSTPASARAAAAAEREAQGLLELEANERLHAKIKVVGVGGGGGNALNTMIRSKLKGVEFLAANTDAQALEFSEAPSRIQLGTAVTRGLGCGANPERGREAALEDRDRLRETLSGADMVFVTAGLGGGTGTGAAPVIAEVARDLGALTVAVVTKPFPFEGRVRLNHADQGLERLHEVVDTLITIPNQRLLSLAGKDTAIMDAFKLADEVLLNAVKGISDLITVHGLINLDFADVRTIMNEMGMALMGTGMGNGDNRAADAAHAAISSPLLEDVSIDGARGVLINISGGADMTLFEVNEASTLVQDAAHEEANIIFGAVIDDSLPKGELRVTVIATGLNDGRHPTRGITADETELTNVTPLHAEPEQVSLVDVTVAHAAEPVPSIEAEAEPFGIDPIQNAAVEEPPAEEFLSPFAEDELDVPAFLRRKRRRSEEDEPAFLRRSAD